MRTMMGRRRTVNVGALERQISLGAGSLLTLYVLRRSFGSLLLLGLGGYLMYRGATGNCRVYQMAGFSTSDEEDAERAAEAPRSKIEKAVTINKSPSEVYQYWRKLDNLPAFMDHLESVTATGDATSHWVAKAPVKAEWDAEITHDRENEYIAWRSLPGSQVDTSGHVRFRKAPDGYGTEVSVSMEYAPPGGILGATAARLFRPVTAQQVKEDLRRFKEMMEAGQVVTVKGQPTGRQTQRKQVAEEGEGPGETAHQRHRRDVVERASEDSFPASDPPGWTARQS